MTILKSILLAVGLCADSFAVSLCSSLSLRCISRRKVIGISLGFAVIHTLLLLIGWLFGNLFAGLVWEAAHIIGFLLLLYVGGGMLLEGIRGKEQARDLNGWVNVILGGISTSIDALAVGAAQSLSGTTGREMGLLFVFVFFVTVISVVAGITGGRAIGSRFGRWAEIAGGCVLVGIGVSVLLS